MPTNTFFVSLVALLVAAGCHRGDPAEILAPDSGTTGDTDTDDAGAPTSWDDATIVSANAPDGYAIRVEFGGEPPADEAGDPLSYSVDSDWGELDVESVEFDPQTGVALLTTERQKLGVTYQLTVSGADGEPVEGLTTELLAADTFRFWVTDFTTYNKYEIVANRFAVGTYSVVYVEQGWNPSGAEQVADHFDNNIYPIETQLFGESPDLDGNGRITLLGLDGGPYYGGYFDPINAYTDAQAMSWWGIHSNEMEMVHINVSGGDFDASGHVTPHEFQHLLYHEEHGFTDPYWEYHNEGLSECAVHAVLGSNDYAVDFYLWDYQGKFAEGLSLVNWTYALYENYALAYLFWTYLASRIDGVDTYSEIFELDTGSPAEVDELIAEALGSDFATVQLESLIANWVRAPSGVYGYGGMVTFPSGKPPTVEEGTSSVDLEPFAGTFFELTETSVDYPGTEGEHIVYVGIDSAGDVDLEAPFDVSGGGLLVFNSFFEYTVFEPEHAGPDLPASAWKSSGLLEAMVSPAWNDPPPVTPDNLEPLHRWQEATAARLGVDFD
jgi:hypothetical protein